MRNLRSFCAASLMCGLAVGFVTTSGGCDSSPADGTQVSADATTKQQLQERGEKMKAFMAKKTKTARARR